MQLVVDNYALFLQANNTNYRYNSVIKDYKSRIVNTITMRIITMPIIFYPPDRLELNSIQQRLEMLMEAAENFKASVLDLKKVTAPEEQAVPVKKRMTPRDIQYAFNWEELAKLLREIRDLAEGTTLNKQTKSDYLTKLAEIYEVLRGAKMAKLEAVRLALINEANQLQSGSTGSAQVA